MKKTNLFKKMTSLFLAIMMIMSVVPMMASAEVPDGKFWQTVVDMNMDSFTDLATEWTTSDTAIFGDREVTAKFCWGSNGKYVGSGGLRASGGHHIATDGLANKPEGVGDYLLVHHGACTSGNSWIWTSSDSGWAFSNIWDPSALSVGDKVKITAQVYAGADMATCKKNTSKNCWEPVGYTDGFDSDGNAKPTSGPMRLLVGTQAQNTTVNANSWNTLTIEVDITADNINSNTVQIDSGVPAEGSFYVQRWGIGSVEVEVLTSSNGSYTIEDGGEFEVIDEMNMDGFQTIKDDATDEGASADEYVYTGYTYSNKKVLEDGRTQWIRNLSEGGPGISAQRTGINALSSLTVDYYGAGITNTAVLPDFVGENAMLAGKRWGGSGTPAPYSSIRAYNIFDEDDVQVNDTVKVTAWVYAANVVKWVDGELVYPSNDSTIDTTSPIEMRMWLSETEVSNEGVENDFGSYSYTTPKTDGTEQIVTTVTPGTWVPISFTYKVTEENKGISSIRIDGGAGVNGQRTSEWTFLAGIRTEKLVDTTDEVAGRITGTVAAAPATVETGADYRVLVGAYKKVGDVYMMLGCNILPYEADCSYDFVINDAEGATDVFAYLWDFNAYEPQIVPIECTYIAQ